MDFSVLKRLEVMLAMAIAAGLGAAGTVVVVQEPAVEVAAAGPELGACEAEVAALRAAIEERQAPSGAFERLKQRTDTGIQSRPIGIDELRRNSRPQADDGPAGAGDEDGR